MAKKSIKRAEAVRLLTVWDGEKYFDATFTDEERDDLRQKLMEICGYGPESRSCRGIHDYLGFDYDIERPAQDAVYGAFVAQGFEYKRDQGRLHDYALIHICRELNIDYKSFAANTPKLPIDGFIKCAKRAFPEFRRPRNKIEATIQERKLHLLWCDWHNEECGRTGCTRANHWICSDRFVDRDYPAILEQIATCNETRPKLQIVAESMHGNVQRKRRKSVLRLVDNS